MINLLRSLMDYVPFHARLLTEKRKANYYLSLMWWCVSDRYWQYYVRVFV